ncbi:hypothetical protein Tco_0206716 [Tanacetum coccineum]
MANGEDCLDGCDAASGGEVKGGGVDFGVLKSSSGEILGETMGERGGDMIGLGGGLAVLPVLCAAWNRPSVMKGTGFCRPAETFCSSVCLYENNVEVRLSRLKRKKI